MFIIRFTRNDRYQEEEFGTTFDPEGIKKTPDSSSYTTKVDSFTKQVFQDHIDITLLCRGLEAEVHRLNYKEAWAAMYVMNDAGDTVERIVAPDIYATETGHEHPAVA